MCDRLLARQGCRRFHLIARNPIANQALASELGERFGAEVSIELVELLAANQEPPILREPFDLYLTRPVPSAIPSGPALRPVKPSRSPLPTTPG